MKDEPLGLPKGSVRSILVLAMLFLVGGIAVYLVTQHVDAELTAFVVGGLVNGLGVGLAFYFTMRQGDGS
jgi:uncharacterized membrane-anchored protein